MKRQSIAAMSLLFLAGCSDPASEAPVDPLPGNYAVTVDAGLGASAQGEYCLKSSEISNWPHALVQKMVDPERHCTRKSPTRTGNLAAGVLSCSTGLSRETAVETRPYTARIEAESVSVKVDTAWTDKPGITQEQKADVDQLNSGEALPSVNYQAKRTGDC